MTGTATLPLRESFGREGDESGLAGLARMAYVLKRPTLFVFRCCGEVDAITPATGIYLTPDKMFVLFGERPVAVYDRRDVYFATGTRTAPPVLT